MFIPVRYLETPSNSSDWPVLRIIIIRYYFSLVSKSHIIFRGELIIIIGIHLKCESVSTFYEMNE